MDNGSTLSLFPVHCSKTIHLVRHAQGIHNVEGDKNFKSFMSPEYFDAHLTQLGWQQVDSLHQHVHASGLIKKVELVITSPLLRTMQTAVGVFGGEYQAEKVDELPLMVANAGNSGRDAVSSLNCPPILAVELCREHLGVRPCDKRRSINEYKCLFPAVDFSLVSHLINSKSFTSSNDGLTVMASNTVSLAYQIESNDDVMWKPDIRETNEELAARGIKFFSWLFTRKEKEIAIVTHSGFLFHTLAAFGNDCHPLVKKEISGHFANCELRSMLIIDNSEHASSTTTNYPGNIPSGKTCAHIHAAANENNQERDTHNSLHEKNVNL